MIVHYFTGVSFLLFSILAIYPIFHDQNIVLGIILAIGSISSFWFFTKSTTDSNIESVRFRAIKTIYVFILTLVLQLTGLWVYIEVISKHWELTFLTPIFKVLFGIFQISFGWNDGSLYLNGVGDYSYTFTPNIANFGMIYLTMATFSFLGLFVILKERKLARRCSFFAFISLFSYLFFRVVALVMLFLIQPIVDDFSYDYYMAYFWHSLFGFLSFIPWLLIIGLRYANKKIETIAISSFLDKASFKKYFVASVCLGSIISILTVAIFWIPSGKAKQGRILLEEYYSDWSKSTKPIDEYWYGTKSTYNYYTFRKYISSFYNVTVNEQPLENVDLDKYDILILKVPTKNYPKKVIRQIVNYVHNGGGLWVIGDHTNVFGSSAYLNPLLRYFGVQLRYDAVSHNETRNFNFLYTRSLIKHPIIQKVPVFLFATPCTLEVRNPLMRTVISGETTKTHNISYTRRNFFPDIKPDLNTYYGSMTLFAAGNYGRGRVAVFTDSTVFSNFYIYLPGKTELALSTINWLNHRQLAGLKFPMFLLVIVIFIIFLRCYKKVGANKEERNLIWPVAFGIVFLLITVSAINFYNIAISQFPEAKEPLVKVGFLDKYSSIYLPYSVLINNDKNNYNTFYTWGQRVGLCNQYFFELEKALEESKAIFMVLPKRRFDSGDLEKLDNYLRNGGKIFLFDDGGKGSSANQFLAWYNLSLEFQKNWLGNIVSKTNHDFQFNNILPVGTVSGDSSVLFDWVSRYGARLPVLVRKKVGKGELYVFGGIRNFSNAGFGSDRIVPTGDKKQINDLILQIYRFVIDKEN